MVSTKPELINVKEAGKQQLTIELVIAGERKVYQVPVIDSHGVFGLELPLELLLSLRSFPPKTSRNLIAEIKQRYQLLTASPELQAA